MRKFKLRGITTKAGQTRWYAWVKRDWAEIFSLDILRCRPSTFMWVPLVPKDRIIVRLDSGEWVALGKPQEVRALDGSALPIADNREDAEMLCRKYAQEADAMARRNSALAVVYDTGPVYFEIKGGMP